MGMLIVVFGITCLLVAFAYKRYVLTKTLWSLDHPRELGTISIRGIVPGHGGALDAARETLTKQGYEVIERGAAEVSVFLYERSLSRLEKVRAGIKFLLAVFLRRDVVLDRHFYRVINDSLAVGTANERMTSYEKIRVKRDQTDLGLYLMRWRKCPGVVLLLWMGVNAAFVPVYYWVSGVLGFFLLHCWLLALLAFSGPYYLYRRAMGVAVGDAGEKRRFYRAFYDHYFDAGKGRYHYFLYKALEAYAYRSVVPQYANFHPNLEVGFYDGQVSAFHLSDVDYFDYGIEMVKGIELAEGAPSYRNVVHFALQDNDWEDDKFAAIYMIHIVDHFTDIESYLEQTERILRPGGIVVVSGCSDGISSFAGSYNHYNLDKWQEIFEHHGLMVEKISALQSGWLTILTYRIPQKLFEMKYLKGWVNRLARAIGLSRSLFSQLVYWSHLLLFLIDEGHCESTRRGINFFAVLKKRDPRDG
jgi:SAM-dependent methyltransferase